MPLSLTRVTKSYLLALGTTQISSYLPRDMFRFRNLVQCLVKPGFFVVSTTVLSTCQPLPNNSHALPRKVVQVGRRCPRLWHPRGPGALGYGRTWVHLIAFSRCGLNLFFRFFASQSQPAASTKKSTPAPLSFADSTARRSAVRCGAVRCRAYRAVPCCAVLCSAVPCCTLRCCAFSFVHTWREPACPRALQQC